MSGPNHLGPVPKVDIKELVMAIMRHVDKRPTEDVFDFLGYININRSNKCHVPSMLAVAPLVKTTTAATRTTRMLRSQLKDALLDVIEKRAGLNRTKHDDKYWAATVARQYLVLVAHIRGLLPRTYRYEAAIRGLDESQVGGRAC